MDGMFALFAPLPALTISGERTSQRADRKSFRGGPYLPRSLHPRRDDAEDSRHSFACAPLFL